MPEPTRTTKRLLVLSFIVLIAADILVASALFGIFEIDFSAPRAQAQAISATPTQTASLTPSRTPFQALTYTATATATPTFTPTNTATATPVPTNTPLPPPPKPSLPDRAYVSGVVGHPQTLGLSCESRSAVDWASFYGYKIGELDFLGGLPRSDNPEKGFVGNPNGVFGQIPPNPYGVHAAPVGALLRAYGIPAIDERGFGWDELRGEIADGQPVIVWVIGSVWRGYAVPYTASDGETVTVAPMEHTVIVVGYSERSVTVVDNHLVYNVSVDQFLASWGVLGNQAVFYK